MGSSAQEWYRKRTRWVTSVALSGCCDGNLFTTSVVKGVCWECSALVSHAIHPFESQRLRSMDVWSGRMDQRGERRAVGVRTQSELPKCCLGSLAHIFVALRGKGAHDPRQSISAICNPSSRNNLQRTGGWVSYVIKYTSSTIGFKDNVSSTCPVSSRKKHYTVLSGVVPIV